MSIVYALIVFMLASVLFFSGAVRKEAESVLAGSPEIIVQRTVAGRHELIPAAYAETVKSIRGVRKVEGRLWGYYYHQASRANYTVMATDGYSLKDDQVAVGEGVRRTWQGVLEQPGLLEGLRRSRGYPSRLPMNSPMTRPWSHPTLSW